MKNIKLNAAVLIILFIATVGYYTYDDITQKNQEEQFKTELVHLIKKNYDGDKCMATFSFDKSMTQKVIDVIDSEYEAKYVLYNVKDSMHIDIMFGEPIE